MSKLDDYRITKKNDKRYKLNDKDRQEIKDLYKNNTAIREIARLFESKCSRRLIQFVLFPERDKKLKEISKQEKRHLKYYDKEKRKKYMQVHRAYKKKLQSTN